VLSQRRFVALLLLAWAPFLVRAVQIYIAASFPQAAFLAASADTFRGFLAQQAVFVFFVTIAAGSGLIADDRRANALPLYLSRPLTRAEYILGKATVLLVLLLGVTWLPAMILLVAQVAFAGPAFIRANAHLVPAITLLSVIEACLSAFAMLALSSLSRSRRFVAVMYAGIIFFAAAVSRIAETATGGTSLAWLSPEGALQMLGDAIFRVPGTNDASAAAAVGSVAAMLAASMAVLRRRVRAVDVVT
jgi:ABC-type transport system involved in multi-copper enzyme maturation permease subunit